MRQLTGLDAYHVLEETPIQLMHTMKIVIVDAANAASPVTYDDVRAWAAGRCPWVPPLCRRVVTVPLRLGRPLWIEVPTLDLRYHVQHATLPSPGGADELDALVSELASTPLDRTKPLWRLWFVDGLGAGRVAFVFKLHHAIADGAASARILEELFDGGEPVPSVSAVQTAERVPSARSRLGFALRNQGHLWRRFPSVVRRSIVAAKTNVARRRAGVPPVVSPLSGPTTRFNRPLTPNRSYVDVTVPLVELRLVKDAFGATLNDVFIAVCGGALRRYLDDHDELPARTLTATSPVSLRGADELDSYGNRVSYWYVSLATDLVDPVARVSAVSASTEAARAWGANDPALFADWEDYYAVFELLSRRFLDLLERLTGRPTFNAIVSNVRGPHPLSYRGAPAVAVRSMGPLVRSQGINFTGWSYENDFSIGIHACREHVPDLRALAGHVRAELAALVQAAVAAPGVPARRTGIRP